MIPWISLTGERMTDLAVYTVTLFDISIGGNSEKSPSGVGASVFGCRLSIVNGTSVFVISFEFSDSIVINRFENRLRQSTANQIVKMHNANKFPEFTNRKDGYFVVLHQS